MNRHKVLQVCLIAASALCAASLLVACGNHSKIVDVRANSSVDNEAHQATINVSDVIDGNALVGVLLTYPDGHKQLVLSGNYSGAGSGSVILDDLPIGDYSYKVYAMPAGPDDPSSFPTGQMVEANVAASGAFTIQ